MEPEVVQPILVDLDSKTRFQGNESVTVRDINVEDYSNIQNLYPDQDINAQRANNQTGFEAIRNGFSQLVTGTVGELVKTPGYLASVFEPVEEMDKGVTGLFLEAGDIISKAGEQFAPIYQSQSSQQKVFAPWDSEWLANTIAQFGPTAALVGMSLATDGLATPAMLRMLSVVPEVGKYAEAALLLRNESKLYNTLRTINTTALSRHAESNMEAYQTFQETYSKLQRENPEMSDEEMRKLAGEAGSKVYKENWALVGLDLIQYHGLLHGFGKFGKVPGFLLGEAVPESIEEGLQYTFQKEAKEDLDFKLGKTDTDKSVMETFISSLGDTEMQQAMVQGGIGASVFMGVGKLMDKIMSKYQQPTSNSITDVIQEASKKGDLVNLEKDVEIELAKPETTPEHKEYLQGVKEAINKFKQVEATVDSPYKSEVAKLYTEADLHSQEVEKINTALNTIKSDKSFTNASQSVDYVEATQAPTQIDKLKKKYSSNPLALKVLDEMEKRYKGQEEELINTTPSISVDSTKVVPLVKPHIKNKIEQQFLSEYKLQLGSEVAQGKLDNFQDVIQKLEKEQIQKEQDIEKLIKLRDLDVGEVSQEAKKRLSELYKAEDKNIPSNIEDLVPFYEKNPLTFKADLKNSYGLPTTTTLQEFQAISQTEEFKNKFEGKKEAIVQDTKTKEKEEEVLDVQENIPVESTPIASTDEEVIDKETTEDKKADIERRRQELEKKYEETKERHLKELEKAGVDLGKWGMAFNDIIHNIEEENNSNNYSEEVETLARKQYEEWWALNREKQEIESDANKLSFSDYNFSGKKSILDKLKKALSAVYQSNRQALDEGFVEWYNVEREVASAGGNQYAAHGMGKTSIASAFTDLINLFEKGINPFRGQGALDVATLAGGVSDGTTAGGAYMDGAFTLVANRNHNGRIENINQIGGIIVNEGIATPEVLSALKELFPNLVIESTLNSKSLVEQLNAKYDAELAALENETIKPEPNYIDITTQEEQGDEVNSKEGAWTDVTPNRVRTTDAYMYYYDDGIFYIPSMKGGRFTESDFNEKYQRGNTTKGWHVLYDQKGQVVFMKNEPTLDVDFLRNLSQVGDVYKAPVTLEVDKNYVSGDKSWANSKPLSDKENGWKSLKVAVKVGGKTIGFLPDYDSVKLDPNNLNDLSKFEQIRKTLFNNTVGHSGSIYSYPTTTNIKSINAPRFWLGPRTTDLLSLQQTVGNEKKPIILGLVKNGKLFLNNAPLTDLQKEELEGKFNLSDGAVYWLLTNPVDGNYVPYRLFTNKIKDNPKVQKQIRDIFDSITEDNYKEKLKEVRQLVRWKEGEKYEPDFGYTKQGKFFIVKDGNKIYDVTPQTAYDAYVNDKGFNLIDDAPLQVESDLLNQEGYNKALIEAGYFTANLNAGLFHSPNFKIDLDKLTTESTVSRVIPRGKPKFSIKNNKPTITWNEKEETQWFKDKIGNLIDFNVVDEAEMNSLVESLKHIHNQDNVEAWGFFHNAAVWISKNAKSGTTQHEAFHVIFNLALTKTQQESLLNWGAKEYGIDRNKKADNELMFSIAQNVGEAQIEYTLKIVDALNKIQRNKFDKTKLQGWLNDLSKYGVTKQQLEIFQEYAKDGMTKEEIIASISADLSFIVESNVTTRKSGGFSEEYGYEDPSDEPLKTSYYSNLTVAGGTNYTENEIRTPNIIPSIKGHARFATDNGIGWTRTDDKIDLQKRQLMGDEPVNEKDLVSKTRRILEVQSDIFQKGRDSKNLVTSERGKIVSDEEIAAFEQEAYDRALQDGFEPDVAANRASFEAEIIKGSELGEERLSKTSQNKFLQLLNKDNNWVTFFIKSIIQDSQKKGYEKVLFPKGETAAKIEGHDTLADEIIKIDRLIATAEVYKDEDSGGVFYRVLGQPGSYLTEATAETAKKEALVKLEKQKQELKSQGIEKLKPIEGFYEVKVGNVLKKNYKVKEVVDEYGNGWWEIDLTSMPKETILLSTSREEYYKQLSGDIQIEEKLADAFAEYVQMAQVDEAKLKQTSWYKQLGASVKRVFRKMYLAVKASVGLNLSQDEIFFRIQSGSYKNNKGFKKNVDVFKPSIKAYSDNLKQGDRLNQVQREFNEMYLKFKEEKQKDLKEQQILDRAIKPTLDGNLNEDNIYYLLSKTFLDTAKARREEGYEYDALEYEEMSRKLYDPSIDNVKDRFGPLYYNAIDNLKNYGIRVQRLQGDLDINDETQDSLENWMEVNPPSAYEAISKQIKMGLSALPRGEWIGEEFEAEYDDLGYSRFVDPFEVYSYLKDELSGAISVEDWLNDLSKLGEDIGWAKTLYKILSGSLESSVITDIELFKAQMHQFMQEPAPTFKYLLQTIKNKKEGKFEWLFGNSASKSIANRLSQQWLSNISSPLYNKVLKNNKVDEVISEWEEGKDNDAWLFKTLNDLGIVLSREAIGAVTKKGGNKRDFLSNIKNVLDNMDKDNFEEKLSVKNSLIGVAKLVKKYYPEFHLPAFTNVEGETVQNYIRNSFMARQINKFKSSKYRQGLLDFYRQDAYYAANDRLTKVKRGIVEVEVRDESYSLWLDRLKDHSDKLEFAVLDGQKLAGQTVGTPYADLSPLEFNRMTLNAFYNNGNYKSSNEQGKSFYSAQIMADSGSHAYIGFESYSNEAIVNKLVLVAKNEYYAYLENLKEENKTGIKGYNPRLLFIPGLIENKNNLNPKELQEKTIDLIRNEEKLRLAIETNLDKIVKETMSSLEKEGLVTKEEDGYSSVHLDHRIKDIPEFISNFVYNDFFAQTQIISLFHGKLYQYKSMEDFYKRAKEIWSPGNFIDTSRTGVNQKFMSYFVDSKSTLLDYSNNKWVIDDIYNNIIKAGFSEDDAKKAAAGYGYTDGTNDGKAVTLSDGKVIESGNVDSTDAQGIIDIHRWREIMLGKGMERAEVERIYDAILNDTYTVADLSMVMNPIKQFYYTLTSVKGQITGLQIKNSEYVLIPQIAKGNPKLEATLKFLDESRKKYGFNASINYDSAIKVGLHKVNKSIEELKLENAIELDNNEYRIQGEVPEHQVDTTNLLGTQLRKLIVGDLDLEDIYNIDGEEVTGKILIEEWNKLLIADVEAKSNKLKKEFGDPTKFYKMLQDEAVSRDYPDKFIEALTLVDGKPRLGLFHPLLTKKTQALISSVYRNNITKMKFNGMSTPNVSAFGSDELKIVYNEDGSIKYFEAYLPLWSEALVQNIENIDYKALEDLGLDLGVSYRIPTEAKYSMIPIKIKGFTNAGIVLPNEITKVAGLDYDIDKMYTMLYEFITYKKDDKTIIKKPVYYTKPTFEAYKRYVEEPISTKEQREEAKLHSITKEEYFNELAKQQGLLSFEDFKEQFDATKHNVQKARDNRKLDIIRGVLTNPKSIKAQLTPGGFDDLEAEANRIEKIKGSALGNINPMTLISRVKIFSRMMAGKKLIGIPANYNATHALMQHNNLELTKPVLFNGQVGKDLGQIYTFDTTYAGSIKKEDIEIGQIYEQDGKEVKVLSIKGDNIKIGIVDNTIEENEYLTHILNIDEFVKRSGKATRTKLVSNNFAQYLASVVDNGKNPLADKYNLNTYTADVAMLLAKFFPIETGMKFIAQPSIVEFYKEYVNEGANFKAESKAVEKTLGVSKKEFNKRMENFELRNISDVELEQGLKDNPREGNQADFLMHFLYYKNNQAKDLGTLVAAIKVPDSGASSSLAKTVNSISKVEDALSLETITGIKEFLNNENLANSSLYEKGILDAMREFVNLGFPDYISKDSAFVTIQNKFKELKGSSLGEKEIGLINDASYTFLSSGFLPLKNINRLEILEKTPNLWLEFIKLNRKEYYALMGSIETKTSEVDDKRVILQLDNNQPKDIENKIMNQWEDLLNSNKPINNEYTEGDLGRMLTQYAFVTNGFRFTTGSLSHIQPISFYENLTDGIQDFNTYIEQQIDSANNSPSYLDQFYDQFVRHYFPRLSYVKSVEKEEVTIRFDEKTKEPYSIVVNDIQSKEYIKYKDVDTKQWYLFKLDFKEEDGTSFYNRVNPLGLYREAEEWNFELTPYNSVFEQNNMSKEIETLFDNYVEANEPVANSTANVEVGSSFDKNVSEPTPIKTGFQLNTEQQEAVDKAVDFIKNGKQHEYFVIEGKAGTGKTTIAEQIAKEFKGKNIQVAALSHKAKSVIRGKFIDAGLDKGVGFQSIASLLGQSMDLETGKFDVKKDDNFYKEPPIANADIIIIDEASMVNEQALELIMEGKRRGAKVIFLGDIGQLPPIRTVQNDYYKDKTDTFSKKSPVFESKNKAKLLERVRQGEESPILPYADYFWENSQVANPEVNPAKEKVSKITTKGSLVFTNTFGNIKDEVLASFKKAVKENKPNHIKVVTYRNDTRKGINKLVHDTIFGTDSNEFNKGELIIFNSNYPIDTEKVLENSFETQIIEAGKIKEDANGVKYQIIEIDAFDTKTEVPVVLKESVQLYNDTVSKLFKTAFAVKGSQDYRSLLSAAWGYKNKYANIDYAYAITSHKSQGSTYDIVVVDEKDIMSVGPITAKEKSESIYTALTRPRNVAIVISSTKVDEVLDNSIEELNDAINNDKKPVPNDFKNSLPKTGC